jgi:hypothetical protein
MNGRFAAYRRVLRAGRQLMVLSSLVAAAACATTRAETPREWPALDVPIPPPRVITPLPPPEAPTPEPVADLPGSSAPAPTRPRPLRPPETTAKPDPKPEEKPAENPPPNTTPPVPQLRTPEVGNSAQTAQQIRDTIERAKKTLENIDYRTLVPVRQKAYDDSKLFYTQAEENLKNNNLLVAKELADKAERLAKELQGR